jgi:hypothetical protein
MFARLYICCGLLLLASPLAAITPGGSYNLFNASSSTVEIQTGTVDHPQRKPWDLPRGFGDGGSGDHSALIYLRVKYPSGRVIIFDAQKIVSIKASRPLGGAWWVDDDGITYISSRDANLRRKRLFGHL